MEEFIHQENPRPQVERVEFWPNARNHQMTELLSSTSTEKKTMRVFVLATMLLASSSLCSFAQEQGKPPVAAPQAGTSTQTDQNSQPQRDQRTDRDQPKADGREMGRGGMMRRGDGDRMGRDDHEMGQDWRMHRDRESSRDRDSDRGRYSERGDRDWDRAERDSDHRGYSDGDQPRRRVKVCFEYDNGDEYCRYRQ